MKERVVMRYNQIIGVGLAMGIEFTPQMIFNLMAGVDAEFAPVTMPRKATETEERSPECPATK